MKIGSTDITNCKIGSTQVNEVRIGSTLVWSAFTGVLDLYTGAAAAYSLRKLRSTYSGSAIRVRRSSDNAEQDVGFNSSNELDIVALLSFVGANNGFITSWYDQSGNGLNITQSSSTAQAQIVASGSLVTILSKPTGLFDGVNDFLENTSASFMTTNPNLTTLTVGQKLARTAVTNDFMTMVGIGSVATTSFYLPYRANGTSNQIQFRASGGTNSRTYNSASNYVNGSNVLMSSYDNGSNVVVYRNGTSVISSSATALGTFTDTNLRMGHIAASGASFWRGYISEMIIYPTAQTANRVGIETNINNYYGIY